MSGALELIQSFNNPKIIDAPGNILKKCQLHWWWGVSLSSEISYSYLNFSLELSTNHSVLPLKLSSRTILVTYWVSLLFSETPLDEVLMWSLSSHQTA